MRRANQTDRVEYAAVPGAGELRFRFQVVRVWELPAEDLLNGGVGFLPLAVLGKPPAGKTRLQALPELVERIAQRVESEAKADAADVMTATYILAGMHTDPGPLRTIFQRVMTMIESSAFQVIREDSAIDTLHRTLLTLGRAQFGGPTPEQEQKLKGIKNLDRLDRLVLRVLKVSTWDDLLKGR
jgi:hypothetical protein